MGLMVSVSILTKLLTDPRKNVCTFRAEWYSTKSPDTQKVKKYAISKAHETE